MLFRISCLCPPRSGAFALPLGQRLFLVWGTASPSLLCRCFGAIFGITLSSNSFFSRSCSCSRRLFGESSFMSLCSFTSLLNSDCCLCICNLLRFSCSFFGLFQCLTLLSSQLHRLPRLHLCFRFVAGQFCCLFCCDQPLRCQLCRNFQGLLYFLEFSLNSFRLRFRLFICRLCIARGVLQRRCFCCSLRDRLVRRFLCSICFHQRQLCGCLLSLLFCLCTCSFLSCNFLCCDPCCLFCCLPHLLFSRRGLGRSLFCCLLCRLLHSFLLRF
mmetsp:Transcript_28845/g.47783  ORF Transcript_28845/g.47783 Transcript_28845/m.47783 type:complete len:271 (+) Transcript_28845:290-1102(+)